MNLRQDAYESRISFYLALLFQDRIAKMSNIHFKRERNTFLYITLRLLLYLSPVKRICVFEHSVITNFNCACPAIQRGQGSGFLSEGSS